MPKRKPARKKPSAPKTAYTHIMGTSGRGKGDFFSATLEELHDTGKPFGVLEPQPPKLKTKKG
jgi:hypothetical protein